MRYIKRTAFQPMNGLEAYARTAARRLLKFITLFSVPIVGRVI